MKTLVVFYSLTGKTRLVAETIANETKADLKEIEETKPRKVGPLTHLTGSVAAILGRCSDIKPINAHIEQYDLVFIGSPIWFFRPAPAINTFISTVNLKVKQLVLFFTMGGTGYQQAAKAMGNRVQRHSGKVSGSFAISSGRATDEEIVAKTKEAIAGYL